MPTERYTGSDVIELEARSGPLPDAGAGEAAAAAAAAAARILSVAWLPVEWVRAAAAIPAAAWLPL